MLGGLVGAGASFLAAPFVTPAPRPDPRIAVLEERLGAVPPRDQIGSLERRLATLEGEQTGINERLRAAQGAAERGLSRAEEALARPAPATGGAPAAGVPDTALAELTARLDALEGRARQQDAVPAGAPQVSAVPDDRLAALARQVDEIENAVRERGRSADATAGAEPRLAEQDRRLGEIDSRLSGVETAARERAQELSGTLGNLRETVQRLEGSVQGVQSAVQPLPNAVQNLDRRLGEQDGRLTGIARQVEAQGGRLEAVGQQIQAQDGRLAEIGGRLQAQDGRIAEVGQQLRGQDERLATLGQGVGGQEARLSEFARLFAERDPGRPLRVVAADRVAQSLRDGSPFAPALDALRRLGVDPVRLGALEPFAATGAPAAAALLAEFRPLAERMAREGRPPAASLTDRLRRMADEVVTVRSVGEADGTDVQSLLARIDGALGRGAVADAAAAFDALPEAARVPAEAFGRKLRERAAAETAAREVSAEALAALAAPR